VVLNHL